jgi:hypothetical protein
MNEDKSKMQVLADILEMDVKDLRSDAIELVYMKVGFRPGDMVKFRAGGGMIYEVAAISHYPHGWMVGIYDEPPGNHIDFWNPSSLHKA